MEKDIIMGGIWNISGKRYNGDLIFNKSNGVILLSIYIKNRKLLSDLLIKKEFSEITGLTNQQEKCILTDCKIIKRHNNNFIKYHILIKAKSLFWGLSKRKKEYIKFNEVRFELSNIFQWSKLNGFEIIDDPKNKLKWEYNFKDKIIIEIDENTKVQFVPILDKFKYDTLVEDIHLKQFVSINIIKNKPTFYEKFFEDVNKIIIMIMIATNTKININKITCLDYSKYQLIGENKNYFKYEMISYLMKKDDEGLTTDSLDSIYYLYDLPELCIDNKINNWFKTYDKYKSIYDLYLLGIKNDVPPEIRFSNLMQALELIHSIKYDKLKKFILHIKEKFADNPDIIDNIINNDSQKNTTYIILRSRLIDLFVNPFELNFTDNNNLIKFSDILADSRNYYTHYKNSKKNKCVVKNNLTNSIFILKYLVSCYILENLGFSIEYINNLNRLDVKHFEKNNFVNKILENSR